MNKKRVLGCLVLALVLGTATIAWAAKPGSLDRSFARTGSVSLGSGTRLFATTVQSDGKIVAVGQSGTGSPRVLIERFTKSGGLDRKFGSRGVVHGPAVQPGSLARAVAIAKGGKIVVVGSAIDASGRFAHGLLIERYNSNGRIDRSFGSHGVVNSLTGSGAGDGYGVAVQSNGKIVASGSSDGASPTPQATVIRLNANGKPDGSFGSHGTALVPLGPYSFALGVALAGSKIVIAGSQAPDLQVTNAYVARLTGSGGLDHSFHGSGFYANQYAQKAAFSSFNSVVVHRGRIYAGGSATVGQSQAKAIVVRFTGGGSPDGSFGSGGVASVSSATNFSASGTTIPGAASLAVASNGGIFATGALASGGTTQLAVWGFSSRGGINNGFGSHGLATLSLKSANSTQGAGIAASGRNVVVAGDSLSLGSPYRGLLARFVAR